MQEYARKRTGTITRDALSISLDHIIEETEKNIDQLNSTLVFDDNAEVVPIPMIDQDNNNIEELVVFYRRIRQLSKILETKEALIEDKIKSVMGDKEVITDHLGLELVTWKHVKSNRLDSSLLKGNYPGIYEECVKELISRRFVIK